MRAARSHLLHIRPLHHLLGQVHHLLLLALLLGHDGVRPVAPHEQALRAEAPTHVVHREHARHAVERRNLRQLLATPQPRQSPLRQRRRALAQSQLSRRIIAADVHIAIGCQHNHVVRADRHVLHIDAVEQLHSLRVGDDMAAIHEGHRGGLFRVVATPHSLGHLAQSHEVVAPEVHEAPLVDAQAAVASSQHAHHRPGEVRLLAVCAVLRLSPAGRDHMLPLLAQLLGGPLDGVVAYAQLAPMSKPAIPFAHRVLTHAIYVHVVAEQQHMMIAHHHLLHLNVQFAERLRLMSSCCCYAILLGQALRLVIHVTQLAV